MPKKTKKEKLLALYHKKIRLLENKETATPVPVTQPVSFSPDPKPIVDKEIKNLPFNQYFFSDLKKSLILITLIIGLEISLYFAKLIR
jgi:hypothetical protein